MAAVGMEHRASPHWLILSPKGTQGKSQAQTPLCFWYSSHCHSVAVCQFVSGGELTSETLQPGTQSLSLPLGTLIEEALLQSYPQINVVSLGSLSGEVPQPPIWVSASDCRNHISHCSLAKPRKKKSFNARAVEF